MHTPLFQCTEFSAQTRNQECSRAQRATPQNVTWTCHDVFLSALIHQPSTGDSKTTSFVQMKPDRPFRTLFTFGFLNDDPGLREVSRIHHTHFRSPIDTGRGPSAHKPNSISLNHATTSGLSDRDATISESCRRDVIAYIYFQRTKNRVKKDETDNVPFRLPRSRNKRKTYLHQSISLQERYTFDFYSISQALALK